MGVSSGRGLRRLAGCPRGELAERLDHFVVRNLPKVGIVEADRAEVRVILEADDVIGLLPHRRQVFARRHRYRKNKPLWISPAGRAQRRTGGRARGDAVVDDDRGPARDLHALAAAQIALTPPLDLGELTVADRLEIRLIDTGKPMTSSLRTMSGAPPSTTAPIASSG